MPSIQEPGVPSSKAAVQHSGRGALWVGAGILLSRVVGLVRERVFAFFFGNSIPAAAFRAALRIPNFLQNLFGEGVLSASFIPVYAQLLGQDAVEEADRVAGAVFGLVSLTVAVLVSVGMLATPMVIELIAPGFKGETRALAILLVRILFPASGILVLSAWCLGILNSHRRFFLSYAAPVLWNFALIVTLIFFGRRENPTRLAVHVAYAAVLGSALQFGVQVPTVLSLLRRFRPSVSLARASVRQVLRSFGPIVVGRGVVQISAYLDTAYASLISPRALSALGYAQILYLLPVSLFGMAISAAELPEMSRDTGQFEHVAERLRQRIHAGSLRIAFFVIPSVAALLLLGDVVAGCLLQTGRFSAAETRYTWYLLMGATVGLFATTVARLYTSAFYALKDTRTPLTYAAIRVFLTAILAYVSAVRLPGWLGVPPELGGVGITATTGMAAWLEFFLLRRKLARRIGGTHIPRARLAALWGAALAAGALGLAVKWGLKQRFGEMPGVGAEWHGHVLSPPALHPVLLGAAVLVPFGLLYFALTAWWRVPESRALVGRLAFRRSRRV